MNGEDRRLSRPSRPALTRVTSGSGLTCVELGLFIGKEGTLTGVPFPFPDPHTEKSGKPWTLTLLLKRHRAHSLLKVLPSSAVKIASSSFTRV